MPSAERWRRCRFTINNYTDRDKDLIQYHCDNGTITYCVYGHEIAPTTGTPHLQGYMEFKQMARSKLGQILPRAAIFKCDASASANTEYAKKDGIDVFEYGKPHKQGARSDLQGPISMIQAGATIRQVAMEHPQQFVKYHRGFEKLRRYYIKPRTEPPEVTVIYGKTGLGKSRQAREILKDPYVWYPQNKQWFDGYDGQDEVLFEEFRGQLPFGMMLALLDRYTTTVEVKGALMDFVAKKIVITSPTHPDRWYPTLADKEGRLDQLHRRITNIIGLSDEQDGYDSSSADSD